MEKQLVRRKNTQKNVRLYKTVHTEQIKYGISPPSLHTPHPKQLIYKHNT